MEFKKKKSKLEFNSIKMELMKFYIFALFSVIVIHIQLSSAYQKLAINGNRIRQYSSVEKPYGYEKTSERLTNCEEKNIEINNDAQNNLKKHTRSTDSYYSQDSNCDDPNNCKNNENTIEQQRRNDFSDMNGNGRKTSNIALKAAQEAKAAEEAQELAGKEASKQAKFQLAEKAIQAAKAAQAALAAKKLILEELERELREAEIVVQDLSSSIQQSESNANAGRNVKN